MLCTLQDQTYGLQTDFTQHKGMTVAVGGCGEYKYPHLE